jgi:hypothetical protein
MKSITVQCRGCGRIYTLGANANASMVTASGLTDDASLFIGFGIGLKLNNTEKHPDSIAPLGEAWSPDDPQFIHLQEKDIARVAIDLENNIYRYYVCSECKTQQTYQETIIKKKRKSARIK